MNRRVVTIFGGSGFLGRHIVRRLAHHDVILRIAVRDPEEALYLKPLGKMGQIVPVPADVTRPETVAQAVKGASAVINLVGILSPWGRQSFPAVHVQGAGNVAKAAAEAGVERLVHLSAIGADKDSRSTYGRTKAEGEEAVRAAFPDATILRPSIVFGPEDHFFNLFASITRFTPVLPVFGCPTFPKIRWFTDGKLFDIDFLADGGVKFQPVYVGDVAAAAEAALLAPDTKARTFELGGPRVYSFKEVMELVLRYTARRRLLAPVPFALARFGAWFIEKLPNPLMTRDQLRMMERDNVVAEGALGFSDLDIDPHTAEVVLPTYLHRFRPPAQQRTVRA